MPRTSVRIVSNGQIDTQAVLNAWRGVIERAGYQEKLVKGEPCWSKGDGVMMQLRNFAIAFGEGEVLLQAWTGDALLGESDLTGIVGMLPKKKMKALLSEAETAIRAIL